MKKNYQAPSHHLKSGLLLVVFLFSSVISFAQGDLNIGETYTIELNNTERYNNVTLSGNRSVLTVNGTLIVEGDFIMEGNQSQFIMGPMARVIIYGNFESKNQINISVSSYLIIHGDFIKGGSSGQGDLDVNQGHIYIFGNVDNWGDNFTTCEEYNGNTNDIDVEDCDYGTEDDFANNPDIPEDLLELSNCYDLFVNQQNSCSGNTAIFTASNNSLQNVSSYQWQTNDENGIWTDIPGENDFELVIPNIQPEDSGNQYRVVVVGTEANCKISISNPGELTVYELDISLELPQEICYGQEIEIKGNLVGEAPFQIRGTINGEELNLNIDSDNFTIYRTAIEDLNIEILEVSDNQGCTSVINQVYSVNLIENLWTGNVDNDWNKPSNWSCSILPTVATNVLIPGNLSSENYPVINAGINAFTKNLSIANGASVIVTDNWLRIAGSLTNSGVLNAETGSISFEGSAAQSIPSATFQNNRIVNLRIDNPSGVFSEGILEITGILKVENGNLDTGNELRLISNATQTALIDGSGNGQVVGLVTMQRYLDVAFGYKYFSSPFSDTKAGDFTDIDFNADFPNFYRYDENRSVELDGDRNDATGWEPITDPAWTLNILEGYALNFGENNDPTRVELTGVVNNGSYSKTLENNNREFTRGFHLIGNPYPSPIDWEATEGWDKINIEDGIYFFTAGENQYTGSYTSYVNGVSSTDEKSSNIIPSMQGFFVKVTNPPEGDQQVTGSLTVTNEARVTNFDQQFLKTPEQEEKSLLRLTAAFEGAGNKDALVVYFSSNSGTKFNKVTDAHKLMNTDVSVPNFYSLSEDNINLSINAIPFPEASSYEKIPLGITASMPGRIHINLSDLQNIPGNWNIYLIDNEKRIGQDLRKKSTYSFNIKEGEHNNRFKLMFSKEKITDPAIAFDDLFSVDSRDFIKVNLNLKDGQQGELRVSTVTGQLLEVKEGRGKEQVEFRSITSSGIYFINLYVNDQRYSKKILVNN